MRKSTYLSALLLAQAAACNWTEFDDLKDQATVEITSTPNNDSADFGVALERGAKTSAVGEGGKLVAYGSSGPQFFKLDISPTGSIDVATAIPLEAPFGITNLDTQPVVIADPASDEVSLTTKTGTDHISFIRGDANDNLEAAQMFNVNTTLAAAYSFAPALRTGEQPASLPYAIGTTADTSSTLVRPRLTPDEAVQPRCDLVDTANTPIKARGTVAVNITDATVQDIVVWTADGRLLVYAANVFRAQFDNADHTMGACPGDMLGGTAKPLASKGEVNTGFTPSIGSKIIAWKNDYVILVGHGESNEPEKSFIALYKLGSITDGTQASPPMLIGAKNDMAGLRTAALLEVPTGTFVVGGYPSATVDGNVSAGQLQAFKVDTTTGVANTSALTIQRSGAGKNEQLGRAVAVTPFNGSSVITAGADGKVFVYFATSLYEDAREK